jgi:hypothetical protein
VRDLDVDDFFSFCQNIITTVLRLVAMISGEVNAGVAGGGGGG